MSSHRDKNDVYKFFVTLQMPLLHTPILANEYIKNLSPLLFYSVSSHLRLDRRKLSHVNPGFCGVVTGLGRVGSTQTALARLLLRGTRADSSS